jgi:hypothetical protein
LLAIAWFCITLVIFVCGLLLCLEFRARSRRHVKGCRSLPYITPAALDLLMLMEPDLIVVELTEDARTAPGIPEAHAVSVSRLANFLARSPQRCVFVLCERRGAPVEWRLVERIVNRLAIPNVSVLRGCVEDWRPRSNEGLAVAS